MQHFYDSFALASQICVRTVGLNDDELLPDLHNAGAGVLRTGLGAHQEHLVNQDAQASPCKNVLTILTVFWLGVAGRSAIRADPKESLTSLRQVSKCLTMMLVIYLAKEVAAILRAILTHPSKKLYDDRTAHLLCSNTGCSASFRNCCIHRPVTMPQGQEKGIDPAVAWPVSLHTLGHPTETISF